MDQVRNLGYTAGVAHRADGGGMPMSGSYRTTQEAYYQSFYEGWMAESRNHIDGHPTPCWLASRRHLEVARAMTVVEVEDE